jgi:hypothetical protein
MGNLVRGAGLLVAGALLLGCSRGSDDVTLTAGQLGVDDSVPVTRPTTSTTATPPPTAPADGVCTVAPGASGPLVEHGGAWPEPPGDWRRIPEGEPRPDAWMPVDQLAFDFDGDGELDRFVVDVEAGVAGVHTATGRTVVTGLDLGRVEVSSEDTLPTIDPAEGFDGAMARLIAANDMPRMTEGPDGPQVVGPYVFPVTVHEVTGDGVLDLVVQDGRTLVVLVGTRQPGDRSVPADLVEEQRLGWRSPPQTVPVPPELDAPQDEVEVPLLDGVVLPFWDFTGDGVQDMVLRQYVRRSSAGVFYYGGRPCESGTG